MSDNGAESNMNENNNNNNNSVSAAMLAQHYDENAQHTQAMKDATATLTNSVSNLIEGEARVVDEDMKLLEGVNLVLGRRYEGLASRAETVRKDITELHESYVNVAPYFTQIDELESNVTLLESLVKGLDEYSRRLEKKMLAGNGGGGGGGSGSGSGLSTTH
eukprot:PhM_4_TR1634/c0_g1_i1/m.8927/K16750/BLOC1S2; biogenesis of lysosome-related organelles complex 1 subunit 2